MSPREIDVQIAIHVMQWNRWDDPGGDFLPDQGWNADGAKHGVCPDFSTDPAASKQLRDKMRADGWYIRVESTPQGKSIGCLWKCGQVFTGRADTEEMAFAITALDATGKLVGK